MLAKTKDLRLDYAIALAKRAFDEAGDDADKKKNAAVFLLQQYIVKINLSGVLDTIHHFLCNWFRSNDLDGPQQGASKSFFTLTSTLKADFASIGKILSSDIAPYAGYLLENASVLIGDNHAFLQDYIEQLQYFTAIQADLVRRAQKIGRFREQHQIKTICSPDKQSSYRNVEKANKACLSLVSRCSEVFLWIKEQEKTHVKHSP